MARPSKLQTCGMAQRNAEKGVAHPVVFQPVPALGLLNQGDTGSFDNFIQLISTSSVAYRRTVYSSMPCASASSPLAEQPTNSLIIVSTLPLLPPPLCAGNPRPPRTASS